MIAVITAPREIQTINKCISSIWAAGYHGAIHIFAESETKNVNHENVHRNKKKLGAFGNYNRALTWMIENTTSDEIVILNDDLLLHKDAFKHTKVNFNYGYLCLFTVEQDIPHIDRNQKGWIKIKTGINTWGAGFLMKRETAKQLVEHPFYQERLITSPEKGIDATVSETMLQMNKKMFVHNPSLSEHIGEKSSIIGRGDWPNGGRCGFNFDKWK